MASFNFFQISPVYVAFAAIALILIRRIHWELTVGASRRRIIRDHGCEPAYHYPHKGIGGKLLGLDTLKEIVESAKQGRMMEQSRLRNWTSGRYTAQQTSLFREITMTIEPENIKTILATKFGDYSLGKLRRDVFIPVFGHGIFDTDGAAWERSRALIRPNFVRQQVADLDMFETHVGHVIDSIPRDGSTVDLQPLFFGLTMDSATEFLFGQSTNSLAPGLETKSASDFVKSFVFATESVASEFRLQGISRYWRSAEWKKAIKTVHEFADNIISEALRARQTGYHEKYPVPPTPMSPTGTGKTNQRYTFLNELISMTQDPYTLRSELLNVLLAGRDTTAGLLSNTWHVLSKRPDIFAKLKEEVDTLGGEKPDYSTIKELKYLRWLLNESLRLMPVVPGNSRQAIRDTVLPLGGGKDGRSPLFVPKGGVIAYSPWSMHRREDFYGKDALEFKPERWEHLRPGWEYLPFNGGPRICVGQQYALLEASYTTIRLMQTFSRIETRDNEPWKEWLMITLASGTGCKVALFEE